MLDRRRKEEGGATRRVRERYFENVTRHGFSFETAIYREGRRRNNSLPRTNSSVSRARGDSRETRRRIVTRDDAASLA